MRNHFINGTKAIDRRMLLALRDERVAWNRVSDDPRSTPRGVPRMPIRRIQTFNSSIDQFAILSEAQNPNLQIQTLLLHSLRIIRFSSDNRRMPSVSDSEGESRVTSDLRNHLAIIAKSKAIRRFDSLRSRRLSPHGSLLIERL